VSLIQRAAELIRAGQLVVFPTETVYGLGANALDEAAVRRIYEAKGRPASSPVIVHVASAGMARSLVTEWPEEAGELARRWWPGPLTLVLPKQRSVPDIVTAGLPTVGLRVPAHPLALELLRAAGVPIAAPSANRFSELSPTAAEHVRLPGVALVLDGGPCEVGIESTVLSLAARPPVLLRPGIIPRPELEAVVGPVASWRRDTAADPSPGLHVRHYSPRTPLQLAVGGRLPATGAGAYLFLETPAGAARAIAMPRTAAAYAAILYDTLHRLDAEPLDWIAVEPPPDTPEWAGVLDRLRRAAAASPATIAPSPDQ
jgi:L-threonylcarbamoyladenylate synthase